MLDGLELLLIYSPLGFMAVTAKDPLISYVVKEDCTYDMAEMINPITTPIMVALTMTIQRF